MARLQQSLRQRSSASDSNLRCHEGEWPACSSRRGCDLPRPILFFVAAKENGSACSSRSSDEVRVCSILRCREEERFRLQTATKQRLHRFLNSSSDLGITAGFCQETPSSVHRFLISRPDLGITAAPSLLQRRTARLQRSRGVPAGTGCHEGGIILSKKPPEWRLFLPQQRSASDSNFRCCS